MTTPISDPITGRDVGIESGSPLAALSEFYRAFNERDLTLMERNWLASPAASMDNPLGGIRRGWGDIRTVYERIFQGPARVSGTRERGVLRLHGRGAWGRLCGRRT